MAYKFFSQKLLNQDILDLTQVFPDKQDIAREQNNVSYSLADIVLYLKDVTEEFKFTDVKYVDLDSAVESIVDKYYKSINQENPFENPIDPNAMKQFQKGTVPREAALVEDGKISGKGTAKPSSESGEPVLEDVVVSVEEPVDDSPEIAAFKETLDDLQFYFDEQDEEERESVITRQKERIDDLNFYLEELGEEEDSSVEKKKIELLSEFIQKNQNK